MERHSPQPTLLALLLSVLATTPLWSEPTTVWLTDLDLSSVRQGWGVPIKNQSVTEKPMTIAKQVFTRGLGTHAPVQMEFVLDGRAERFQCLFGVDGAAGMRGSIRLRLYGDSRRLFDSGVKKGGEEATPVAVKLAGEHRLVLVVTDAGDGKDFDHVDLAEARFEVGGAAPKVGNVAVEEEKVLLTPKPGPEPRINGPQVYGVRPGRPVIFRIPTTGQRPLRFRADHLPASLHLDAEKGIVTGDAPKTRGEYRVVFAAENQQGKATRDFSFVVGDTLALTPPMGWNHWYTYYANINDQLFRDAADQMVKTGMADVGYQYVNIDDCWMRKPGSADPKLGGEPRDELGMIRPNDNFPDMKAMTDYIHAHGLKAGLYTSPGPRTCAGYEGSYQHEEADALKFAEWGFDFLKYDWCSYGRVAGGKSLADLQKPYKLMGDLLKTMPRDLVFNLCQYGRGEVWKWGAEVGGHCWRTAGDLGFELGRFFEVALRNAGFHEFVKPGAWNDPDYLLLGYVGHPRKNRNSPDPCPLTPNEQYAYMSLWSLMAAPLFFSGDITRLDEFTLNVLCNPEVIDINQDRLGKGGRVVVKDEESFVMLKELTDGACAVGLFNLAPIALEVQATWQSLGLAGKQRVREVWRQRDLGTAEGSVSAQVPPRGVKLLRLQPA